MCKDKHYFPKLLGSKWFNFFLLALFNYFPRENQEKRHVVNRDNETISKLFETKYKCFLAENA